MTKKPFYKVNGLAKSAGMVEMQLAQFSRDYDLGDVCVRLKNLFWGFEMFVIPFNLPVKQLWRFNSVAAWEGQRDTSGTSIKRVNIFSGQVDDKI